jgi:hypothetical protein
MAEISLKDTLGQLTNIHGPNWKAVVKSSGDREKAKGYLKDLVDGSVDRELSAYDNFMKKEIKNNALAAYGNFVDVDSQGKVTAGDVEFYRTNRNLIEDTGSIAGLSLIDSLKSTGTAFGLEMLNEMLSTTDDPAVQNSIARSMSDMLGKSELLNLPAGIDLASIDHYVPNLTKEYFERAGSDWNKQVSESRNLMKKIIEDLKSKGNNKEFLATMIGYEKNVASLEERAKKYKKTSSFAPSNEKGDDTGSRVTASTEEVPEYYPASDYQYDESKRDVASIESSDEPSAIWIWVVMGIFAVLSFFIYRFANKH